MPGVLGLDELTFPALVGALFVIVLARAQGTYWLGRAVTAGTLRMRRGLPGSGALARVAMTVERWSRGAGGLRALALVRRWGPLAVTLSFLTVGIQTAVNAAAGLSRMGFGRYVVAMVPGCVSWAVIYATFGFATFYGAVALAAQSPWALATGAGIVLGALLVGLSARRRRRRHAAEQPA